MENQSLFGALSKHYKNQYEMTHSQKYIKTVQKQCKITQFRCSQNTTKTNKPLGAPIGALPKHVKNQWKSNHFSVHSQNPPHSVHRSVHLSVHFQNTSKFNGKPIIVRCTLKTLQKTMRNDALSEVYQIAPTRLAATIVPP